MHQTPLDVLEIAMARGGWPSLLSSRSFRRYQGRPGEIIEKLTPEQRATLRELRSDDVGEGKISRYAAWLGYDGYNPGELHAETIHKMLAEFDRKVLRMAPPAREPRKRAYPA